MFEGTEKQILLNEKSEVKSVSNDSRSETASLLAEVSDIKEILQKLFENRIKLEDLSKKDRSYLTEDEASEYCRMEIKTFHYYAIRLQAVPYIPAGKKRVYMRSDLDLFMGSRKKLGGLNG